MRMDSRRMLVLGVVLLAIGALGLAVVWALPVGSPSPTDPNPFTSDGQRIYYTGLDEDGVPIPRSVARSRTMGGRTMRNAACVDCHREDGRGGTLGMMMRGIEAPDIRYSTLTSPHAEGDETEPGWTRGEIARAIRDGVEPGGTSLQAPMPRWDMTDAQVRVVIDYLKELDAP
jgi:mono/diheme cytochrome c family protein